MMKHKIIKKLAYEMITCAKYNNSIPIRLNKQEYLFNINDETVLSNVFDDNMFELSNNQSFEKFISPFTETIVLLFHGVGVGKTCSALQIADNFMNFFDNKTLIIASKNLHSNLSKKYLILKKLILILKHITVV